MRTTSEDLCLQLRNVCLSLDKKSVLKDLSLTARSGQILSIMGPTGSGKTTLLNVMAGRHKQDFGKVLLNGEAFSKRLRRRLAFVQQEDVFFSQLTLMETLMFTANLRIPSSFEYEEKRRMVENIVRELDLQKCINTVMGDCFTKGLSGGEKKRASIASELIVDPDILLLDEPTSNLDSSTALTVFSCLKKYATSLNKMIILSVHQPSSQIYQQFDNLLLLAHGKLCYFGGREQVLPFFKELGSTCREKTNPADFIMDFTSVEQLKSGEERLDEMILKSVSTRRVSFRKSRSKTSTECDEMPKSESLGSIEEVQIGLLDDDVYMDIEEPKIKGSVEDNDDRWMTSWWLQYKVLAGRSVRQTTKCLLQGYWAIQMCIVSLLVSFGYFQIHMTYETSRDVGGLLYVVCTYWTFLPAMDTIPAYGAERDVLRKERASGAYRLSAYYFGRMTGELPIIFTMPVFMFTIVFWMTGLGEAWQFFACLAIVILQVYASLALGLSLAAIFDDARMSVTCLFSYLLGGYLVSGHLNRSIPHWFKWIKYFTAFYHPLSSMSTILISTIPYIPCNQTRPFEHFTVCEMDKNASITGQDILASANIDMPLRFNIAVMICYMIVLRICAYLILRFKKRLPV